MPSARRRLRNIAISLFILVTFLLITIWIASPYLARHFAKQPLAEFGLQLGSESDIALNPFGTEITILALHLSDLNGGEVLTIDEAKIDFSILKLVSRHLHFDSINVSGISTKIAKNGDVLIFGDDFRLPESAQEQPKESTQKPIDFKLTVNELNIEDLRLSASIDELPVELELTKLKGNGLYLGLEQSALEINLDAKVNHAHLLTDIIYSSEQQKQSIDGDIKLVDFPLRSIVAVLPQQLKELTGLFSVESKLVTHISKDAVSIRSDQITAAISETGVKLNPLSLAGDKMTIAAKGIEIELPASEVEQNNVNPVFKVQQIASLHPAKVSIEDDSQQTSKVLIIDELNIGPMDSQAEHNQTEVSLLVKDEEYFSVSVSGQLQPFNNKLNGQLRGEVSELSLPMVSPYLHDALGFGLKSGQVDVKFEVLAQDEKLDGESKVFVRGLEMSTTQEQTQSTLTDGQAMPLNMALDLLKDSQGNIELDIPVSGDASDPSFGLNSFFGLVIQKAVMMQAKNYLINTFVPYANVVTVVMTGADHLLKLRLEPLQLEVAEDSLPESQQQYLIELAKLMNDKPEVQIKTCAVSVAADLSNQPVGELNKRQFDQLKTLSEQRQRNLKHYLVETAGIASSRVLFCEPEFDEGEEALPRIELKTD